MMDLFISWQAFVFLAILFAMTGWSAIRQYFIDHPATMMFYVAIVNGIFALVCLVIAISLVVTHV